MPNAFSPRTLGELQLEFECHDDLAPLLAWHFGRLPDAPDGAFADLVIRADIVNARSGPKRHDGRRVARMTLHEDGQSLAVEHDHGGSATITPHGIDLAVWSTADDRWLCMRQLLYMGLSWSLAWHQHAVIHGALIGTGDIGALILGGTGQGKSTFALAALANGLNVHADDLVVATSTADRGLHVWGIPKRLSVPNATPNDLTDGGEAVPGDNRSRIFLPLDRLAHFGLPQVRIAVAGHSAGPAQLEPLEPQETLSAVLGSFEFARHPDLLKRCFPALSTLGAQAGFHALHGVDEPTRLTQATALLHEILDAES